MSKIFVFNIFDLHYKLKRNLNQFIQLIANIYQHKADNIILPNNTLRVPLKTRFSCSIFLG